MLSCSATSRAATATLSTSRKFARDVERCRGALGTDAHVLPGSQREAADRFAAIIAGGNA
jgi:hypothetical protein